MPRTPSRGGECVDVVLAVSLHISKILCEGNDHSEDCHEHRNKAARILPDQYSNDICRPGTRSVVLPRTQQQYGAMRCARKTWNPESRCINSLLCMTALPKLWWADTLNRRCISCPVLVVRDEAVCRKLAEGGSGVQLPKSRIWLDADACPPRIALA